MNGLVWVTLGTAVVWCFGLRLSFMQLPSFVSLHINMGHQSFLFITDLKITAEAVEILSINYDFLHHFVFFTTSKKRPSNNKASASCA